MDLDDIFDLKGKPKVKLKGSVLDALGKTFHPVGGAKPVPSTPPPPPPSVDPMSAQIAESLGGEAEDADLDVDIATQAKTAAKAHDAYAAAKAAYDMERSHLQEEVEEKLAKLKEVMVGARTAREEAVVALGRAMKKDKITTIPMTDRPDIRIKTVKGSKKGITKKWLVDPENVAVKAYEEALRGEPTFKSGKDFASKVWDEQPKSEDTETVIVPDAYEDEPDHT